MNILLISPERLEGLKESKGTIPVPLVHLAAVLRRAGFTPNILDLSIVKGATNSQPTEGDLFAAAMMRIAEFNPDLIGINCFTTLRFKSVLRFAERIKEDYPTLPICIGGAHPSLFPEEILEHQPSIDYIVVGEGEDQIVALAQALDHGDLSALNDIHAFVYRENGSIKNNARAGFIRKLDELPDPAWDLINFEDYAHDLSHWYNPKQLEFKLSIPIISSRSCPLSCNFCACYATMGRGLRRRSPSRVVDEIQYLHETYGQNYFGFIDDNVNLNKNHILTICNEITRRGLNIQFDTTCGTYIPSLDEEVIDALHRAGCVFVRLPLEHGNDRIRNEVIGKKLDREKIYEVVELLKNRDMFTSSMFIMGFPEETAASLDDTYNMIVELELDLNYVFNLIPFPGTKVFQQAMNEKLFLDDFSYQDLWQGNINLDPVQDEPKFFIKPYKMEIDELIHYRHLFDSIQMFSKKAKEINQVIA